MNFENLNFNIYNIIILAGIFHGLLFGVIIFINKKLSSTTNYFLAFTVISLSLSNLQYMFMDIGIISRYQYETNEVLFIPYEFLMLPFFYLFVKSYLDKKINKNEKRYLFIPFVFCVVYLLSTNHLNDELSFIKLLNLIIEYISIIYTVIIIFLVFKLIRTYEKQNTEYNSLNVIVKTKWLKRMLYIGLILCILWFASLNIFESLFKEGFYKLYPLWIGMSILIYWIAYSAILQKHVYNQRIEIRSLVNKNPISKPKSNNVRKSNTKLFTEITDWIMNNKIYLNPNLSLELITKEFNISSGYLSQILSSHNEQNFNDYINKLRIENAKDILENREYDNYTIVAIGLESGFNSKSSFYTAFKKFTNKTPVQYKKDVLNL